MSGGYKHLKEEEVAALERAFRMCATYMDEHLDRNEPVVRFRTPKELEEAIRVPIQREGEGYSAVLDEVQQVMKYCVRTGHVRFFNQLWAGCDKAAVIGEWVTAVTNASMYTYEVAPVYSLLELSVLEKLRGLVGWTDGDGAFCPGGAHSNLLALLVARNVMVPHMRDEGIRNGEKLVVFTSAQSHYTIKRSAGVLGMGYNGCIKVSADEHGRMIPAALDAAITAAKAEGKTPICISATAGTTVLGAYDNLNALADVAEKHKVWLHVDAAWGGHCLLSAKWRHLMAGADRCDSITWTGTKCLGLPQQCSAVLLKKRDALYDCNAMKEDYLFHDHNEKEWDLGEKTLNCGRRNDVLKLWLSWKVNGDRGFEERVDHAFDQARVLRDELLARKDRYELLVEPESLNVCFFFVPPSARAVSDPADRRKKMDFATVEIRRLMQLDGRALFNFSDLSGVEGHFFRFITCNPHAEPFDMVWCLDYIEELGANL